MLLFGMRAPWVLVLSFPLIYPACLYAQNRAAENNGYVARMAGPGAPASQSRTAESDAYLALLGRYETGDYRGAAEAAARLDGNTARRLALLVLDDVDREMAVLRRLKAATSEAPTLAALNQLRRERVRRLKLTLLVHTEAALRVSDTGTFGVQLTLARDAVARLRRLEEDDRRINGPLDTSRRQPGPTSDAPPPSPGQRAAPGRPDMEATRIFIRDWYLVMASRLQRGDHLVFLKRHVREGLELLGDDPELLLARGSISEAEADTAVIDRSLTGEIYTSDYVHRWRQYMSAAGGDYSAATRRQPDLHEATLRWGRINMHLGDRHAARRALAGVAASGAPAQLRYLAQLFLGDLAEREQQPGRARAAYESAVALFPSAQAPMLALSLLCDGAGESDCARRWLSRSMAATGRGRLDPWWAYHRGQAWLADTRLVAFRASGLQK
jgi:hypothetical protein